AACALPLADPAVSRAHVAVGVEGARLRVKDLASRNGTFVGDVEVHDVVVDDGATLRVGATLLSVERVERGPSVEALSYEDHFGRLLGASREMRRIYDLCHKLAASTVPIVIEGETGTGKEVLAESLHERGPRASGPFVVFECTSAPPSLIESEL